MNVQTSSQPLKENHFRTWVSGQADAERSRNPPIHHEQEDKNPLKFDDLRQYRVPSLLPKFNLAKIQSSRFIAAVTNPLATTSFLTVRRMRMPCITLVSQRTYGPQFQRTDTHLSNFCAPQNSSAQIFLNSYHESFVGRPSQGLMNHPCSTTNSLKNTN